MLAEREAANEELAKLRAELVATRAEALRGRILHAEAAGDNARATSALEQPIEAAATRGWVSKASVIKASMASEMADPPATTFPGALEESGRFADAETSRNAIGGIGFSESEKVGLLIKRYQDRIADALAGRNDEAVEIHTSWCESADLKLACGTKVGLWRGAGAARRPRKPGGSQGLVRRAMWLSVSVSCGGAGSGGGASRARSEARRRVSLGRAFVHSVSCVGAGSGASRTCAEARRHDSLVRAWVHSVSCVGAGSGGGASRARSEARRRVSLGRASVRLVSCGGAGSGGGAGHTTPC